MTHSYVTWRIHTWRDLSAETETWSMGWLWIVGLIKLYVSFAKESYKRDNILQKRPVFLSTETETWSMGWLRLVGSIQLKVSFAEYCLFQRALLQKRRMILSMLLCKATPYLWMHHLIRKLETIFLYSCVTWFMHVWRDAISCDVTHLHVPWLIHVGHDSFICCQRLRLRLDRN